MLFNAQTVIIKVYASHVDFSTSQLGSGGGGSSILRALHTLKLCLFTWEKIIGHGLINSHISSLIFRYIFSFSGV